MGNRIVEAVERLLFGATAEERADMLVELAARRMEQRIGQALDRLAQEGDTAADTENPQQDQEG